MHEVLEIIMPQVDNVEEAVKEIMAPFDEDTEDRSRSAFWDFWVIGGRFAGSKLTAALDKEKLAEFYEEMNEKKITVSGLICGKQELDPDSQIPVVDSMWSKYFPEFVGRACPIFNHANNQYTNDCLYGDVLRLKDTSLQVEAGRVIFANYDYKDEKLEAIKMLTATVWNGVNYEETVWDGTIGHALELYKKMLARYAEGYIEKNTVADDWIVVTVDYHS